METALQESVASDLGRNIQPTFGYYRQPNGDITISPITRLERINYMERGWEHLAQYGAFDLTPYVVNHKFEGLLMMGGAQEFSTKQLIETGMYFNPPLVPTCRRHITQYHRAHTPACWIKAKPAEFPQLKHVDPALLGPFICEFCERQIPTAQGLTQHQSVAHKEELARLQTGRSMGQSLAAVLGGESPTLPRNDREVAELRSQVAAMEKQLRELSAKPKRTWKQRATTPLAVHE